MISRRAFLKTGALLGGAVTAAAVLGDAFGWGRLLGDDLALAQVGARLGAVLVPADHVSWLIRSGALAHLPGAPGRAHDPEGRWSTPFRLRALTIHEPGAKRPPTLRGLGPTALWPADARTATAAALLALDRSPNAADSDALAAAERWLRRAQPHIANPTGRADRPTIAWQDFAAPGFQALREGLLVTEWDWVILAHAPEPHRAEDFIRQHPGTWQSPPAHAIALTGLPAITSFEVCRIYERVAVGLPA
ncbi:MAG TPA: hypothetical protein PLC98_04430 [Anaerolineales bacterium]|nr:hypothetical protein [Anaerolineales bacterium]